MRTRDLAGVRGGRGRAGALVERRGVGVIAEEIRADGGVSGRRAADLNPVLPLAHAFQHGLLLDAFRAAVVRRRTVAQAGIRASEHAIQRVARAGERVADLARRAAVLRAALRRRVGSVGALEGVPIPRARISRARIVVAAAVGLRRLIRVVLAVLPRARAEAHAREKVLRGHAGITMTRRQLTGDPVADVRHFVGIHLRHRAHARVANLVPGARAARAAAAIAAAVVRAALGRARVGRSRRVRAVAGVRVARIRRRAAGAVRGQTHNGLVGRLVDRDGAAGETGGADQRTRDGQKLLDVQHDRLLKQ